MLNGLSNFIPAHERLITIEDAAELQLQQPHVGRLETRPPNIEGKGEIRQRDLVKNALRMRPDRIIIGECRGEEAFDMLPAMNTGHEGSMSTVHANSPREALKRLEQMIGMAGMPMTLAAIRSQIASALTLVVQVQRLPDGARRVTSISEITGMEGDVIQMHEIFKFVKSFTDKDGKTPRDTQGDRSAPAVPGEPEGLSGSKCPRIISTPRRTCDVMTLWSVFVLVFVAAILVVQGSFWLAVDLRNNRKAVTRRLAQRDNSIVKAAALNVLRDKQHSVAPELVGVQRLSSQTGMKVSWLPLGLCAAAAAAVVAAPLWWFGFDVWISASAGIAGGPALVALYLMRTRRLRIDRFGAQLPEALDIIVRGLRVGHPFTSAMGLVAREMLPPIGPELGLTMDEITFGQEVMTALSHLYGRVGQDDLLFLVIAVGVQVQTGGNLADVLERLARLMRERVNMRLKVKALSAEGRLSAYFLTAMPFVLFAVVSLMSPNYFTELKGSAALIPALAYAAISILGSTESLWTTGLMGTQPA